MLQRTPDRTPETNGEAKDMGERHGAKLNRAGKTQTRRIQVDIKTANAQKLGIVCWSDIGKRGKAGKKSKTLPTTTTYELSQKGK